MGCRGGGGGLEGVPRGRIGKALENIIRGVPEEGTFED